MQGDELVPGQFVAINNLAEFRFLFIPDPNVNGITRLLLQAVDAALASSNKEVVEITVWPINDPPAFEKAPNYTIGFDANTTQDVATIVSDVMDIDFLFGYNLSVTYTLILTASSANGTSNGTNGNGNGNNGTVDVIQGLPDGFFRLPLTSPLGEGTPCTLSDDNRSINCNHLVERVDPWLKRGLDLFLGVGVQYAVVELNVNDLGNIDKSPNQDLNVTTFLYIETAAGAILGTAKKDNNLALIIAPILGLLAGIVIAALVFFFRRNSSKAAVEAYFDRFALGMEGASNTSPLYEGASKGGESPIYRGGN
jgi:hypothetical protein